MSITMENRKEFYWLVIKILFLLVAHRYQGIGIIVKGIEAKLY